jgi:sporulation protein YlmC with PRC-barrel domain
MVELVRDVLDQQVIDRFGRKAGKVDGVGIEIREGEPPRVVYLDLGTDVLARRISPRLERWVQSVRRWLHVRETRPFHVQWSQVTKVALDVNADIDAAESGPYDVEHWLAEHLIGRIPGSRRKRS